MESLKLYKWLIGTKTKFANTFNTEEMQKNAKTFWNDLDGATTLVIIGFIAIAIVMAFIYYQPYNNKPGRHYRPRHWLCFLGVTFVVVLLASLGVESIFAKPSISGAFVLELKVAIGSAIYASLLYFFVSVFWCNFLPTNAYRLFKINLKNNNE